MDNGPSPPAEPADSTDFSASATHEMTHLLRAWSSGDKNALPRLVEASYAELQKIAYVCLRGERINQSMQANSLVHDAYLRLVDINALNWRDRAHFFAMAARVMRRILVEHARSRACVMHGGHLQRVNFDEALIVSPAADRTLARLDDALCALAEFDHRKAQVVEMRYFGGLTADEIASVLGISHQSVNRDWTLAKAWLAREMSREESHEAAALGGN
jgi:RNA polymerase sigma factor (TIGR02999 family)